MRRMPSGQDVHVKLNLERIKTSKDPNLTLVAGDVLWVNETVETYVQDWVNRHLFFRAGVATTATIRFPTASPAAERPFTSTEK